MRTTRRSEQDLPAARAIFNAATTTIGGLYLATHSVTVTAIGAAASTMLTCCAIWPRDKPTRALDSAILPSASGPDDARDPGRVDQAWRSRPR
jgi:hypothetical protein